MIPCLQMVLPVKVNVTRSPRRPGTPRQAFFTKRNDVPLTIASANRVSADAAVRLTGSSGFVAAQPKCDSFSAADEKRPRVVRGLR